MTRKLPETLSLYRSNIIINNHFRGVSLAIKWRLEDGKRKIEKPKITLKEDLEMMGID